MRPPPFHDYTRSKSVNQNAEVKLRPARALRRRWSGRSQRVPVAVVIEAAFFDRAPDRSLGLFDACEAIGNRLPPERRQDQKQAPAWRLIGLFDLPAMSVDGRHDAIGAGLHFSTFFAGALRAFTSPSFAAVSASTFFVSASTLAWRIALDAFSWATSVPTTFSIVVIRVFALAM